MAEIKVETSKKFTLNWRDILRSTVIAAISAALTPIYTSLQAGSLTIDWRAAGITGLTAALGYLFRNFFEPSKTLIKVTPPVVTKSMDDGDSSNPDDKRPPVPPPPIEP